MTKAKARRRSSLALVVTTFGILLLGLGTGVAAAMYHQTDQLSQSVEVTERFTEANMRTLAQTQRELLELRYLLATDAEPAAVRLQAAFVSQRTQESALSYQRNTLGTATLLERARAARRTWTVEVLPLVRAAARGDSAAAQAARAESLTALTDLEDTYNTLVSEGEINRRAQASSAHASSTDLVDDARRLFYGLATSLVLALVIMVLGGILLVRSGRERAAASARLVELNHELLRQAQVVHATNSMVMVTDVEGHLEWVNEAFERRTGHTLATIHGRRPGEVLQGPASDPAVIAHMSQARREGRRFHGELANYTASGEEFWVYVDVAPLRDEHGDIAGWVGVQSDVTERHAAQLLLEQATLDAEESAREKASFLATVSHEIRTPLNAVLGLTELLLLTDLDPKQAEYTATAHRSGRHLLALVNDVLDYSALEAGHLATHVEDFDLPQLLEETVAMFAGQAAAKGVALRLERATALPPRLCGDPVRLRQVLVNLVGNALKFTEEGGVVLSVGVQERDLLVRVIDDGIGIPEDRIPALFNSFVRGDLETSRKYDGTGLGLAISRRLVEQMEGRIELTSTVGVGTTVTVVLPLRTPVGTPASRDKTPRGPARADLSGLRVLVAEDDDVNQIVVEGMLRRFGIDAVIVDNGLLAVEQASAGRFDLVLLDVQMPVMDGLEAVSRIRRAGLQHEPWVVALTASALSEDRERFLAAGMDDYLSKPLTLDALEAALGRVPRTDLADAP